MVRFIHPQTGSVVEVAEGFSWTTFLFGPFVPLKRGMHGTALIHAMLTVVTFGFSNLFFAMIINKQYANLLLDQQFIPTTEEDIERLTRMGVFVDPRVSTASRTKPQPTQSPEPSEHEQLNQAA